MTRRTYQLDGEPQGTNSPPAGNTQDLAGYPDVEKLVGGYRNASTEAQRQRARADALEQALQTVNQRPDINPRGHARPEDRLSELGIPVDALDELVNQRLQRAFEPIARGMTARNSVMAQYPDYQKFESNVAQYINSDPNMQEKYNRMFATDPEAAMDYAFLKFGESERRKGSQNGETAGGNKAEKVAAQIPGNRQSESRAKPAGQDDNERLSAAFKAYQNTGDPKAKDAYIRTRLKGIFSEGFFDK